MAQFEKGKSGNPEGRKKGVETKATKEFKEAVNNLLTHAAPKMVEWLDRIAEADPYKAMSIVDKMAEFANPKLSRSELTGKDGGAIETKNITKTDEQILEEWRNKK